MGLTLFILAFIVAIVGVGAAKGLETPALAAAGIALGFVLYCLSSMTVVGTKTVGIETSFGKTVGIMGPGLHWKRPWANVNDWPGTINTFTDSGVKVRLSNSTTATVNVKVQWQVDTNVDVLELYKSFRNFDSIQPNVVDPQVRDSLNNVFGTYDPLALDAQGHSKVIVTDLAKPLQADIQQNLPGGVVITHVYVIGYENDPAIQAQINQKVANLAQIDNNKLIAQANAALTAGAQNLTPEVAYQNCLSTTLQLAKMGELQPGWNCGGVNTPIAVSAGSAKK